MLLLLLSQGDVSTALAGQWADAAAASLGLTADSVLPLLSPLSDMQPIPLAFLTNAHRNHISASSNNNHSSSSRRLRAAPQGVPRVRVRVVASLNKAAACSPKGWQWGGTRSHKEYFLSQGGAHQLYIQVRYSTLQLQQVAAKLRHTAMASGRAAPIVVVLLRDFEVPLLLFRSFA